MHLFLRIFTLIFILSLVSCTQNKSFTLTGNIEGLEAGKKVALIPLDFNLNKRYLDTVYVTVSTSNKFEIKGVAPDSLIACRVVFEGEKNQRYPMLFLENEEIVMTGNLSNLRDVQIKGSSLNEEFYELFRPFMEADYNYEEALKMDKEIDASDSARKYSVDSMLYAAKIQIKQVVMEVPEQNPSSLFSPFLILVTTRTQKEEFVPIYEQFTDEVKNSFYGKILASRLPKVFVGKIFDDVVLSDRNGDSIVLKNNYGKCTLIDFWASWCAPCRKSIPQLKELYEAYHDKGLNIYSISVDKDSAQWVKALDEEQMLWINVRDGLTKEKSVSYKYNVEYIPHMILLDEKGKILLYRSSEDEIKDALQKYLLQK